MLAKILFLHVVMLYTKNFTCLTCIIIHQTYSIRITELWVFRKLRIISFQRRR